MRVTKRRAVTSAAIGLLMASALIAFWVRCQTHYHLFEWQISHQANIAIESYNDGLMISVSSLESPFLDGPGASWTSFRYPELEVDYPVGWLLQIGYP
jgi:hypothetical protein